MFSLLLTFLLSFLPFSSTDSSNYPTLMDRECHLKNSTLPESELNQSHNLIYLQSLLRSSSVNAYIVLSSDEHQYRDVFRRLESLTNFTGSRGMAVVLQSEAAFWTDGRYFLQAEQELDCHWILMKEGQKEVPKIEEWLVSRLSSNDTVMVNPKVVSNYDWVKWEEALRKAGIKLVEEEDGVVDSTLGAPQSRTPNRSIFVHDLSYAGLAWQTKLTQLRHDLVKDNVDGIIVTSPDEIAWLFNLRGHDYDSVKTPTFYAYAFVSLSQNRTVLYVDQDKVTEQVISHLTDPSFPVEIKQYEEAFQDIAVMLHETGKVLVSSVSSRAIVNLVSKKQRNLNNDHSPISVNRAVKNDIEIDGMKRANNKDAVAISSFIAMLEEELKDGKTWDELKAARSLSSYKAEQELYQGDSFSTISASGSNAAIIHYSPQLPTSANLSTDQMYLLDSGGQYLDGTTDITRTFHFGEPTDYQKEAYTRVLMGAIDLMTTVFPEGTIDCNLDIIARRALHEVGLNYLHGTGHGIGTFMGVHEGPVRIGRCSRHRAGTVLKPGMIMSDEPGFYHDGEFGIRLETAMVVVEANTTYRFRDIPYYTFEPLTLVPFEPNLIKVELLSMKQKQWLNEYNDLVRQTIGQELLSQKKDEGYRWLMSRTESLK